MIFAISLCCFGLAAIPALVFARNIRHFQPPSKCEAIDRALPRISILIPARNESIVIGRTITAALASQHIEFEVVILDDGSTDDTAAIVRRFAERDIRVSLLAGQPLPPGWAGKQFACQQLAQHARHEYLLFIDADVRLAPDAACRLVQFQHDGRCDLVSGVPHQETVALIEKLIIPLIHFLLLGYLPLWWMRRLPYPALGVGCGQLFLASRSAYDRIGGHTAVKSSFHDGLQLPREFRRSGFKTDICDATSIAACRMYETAGALWNGLAKNAGEGLGAAGSIIPWTIILFGGQIAPFAFLVAVPWLTTQVICIATAASALSLAPRIVGAFAFRQSLLGAILHPFGIALLLLIQWYALLRRAFGRPVGWKGRVQPEIAAKSC